MESRHSIKTVFFGAIVAIGIGIVEESFVVGFVFFSAIVLLNVTLFFKWRLAEARSKEFYKKSSLSDKDDESFPY